MEELEDSFETSRVFLFGHGWSCEFGSVTQEVLDNIRVWVYNESDRTPYHFCFGLWAGRTFILARSSVSTIQVWPSFLRASSPALICRRIVNSEMPSFFAACGTVSSRSIVKTSGVSIFAAVRFAVKGWVADGARTRNHLIHSQVLCH